MRQHFQHLTVTDCLGTLSLPEVISACDSCDAVITHDTGPLHLAGLSEACLVGIFGPTDPSTRVPRRPGAVGIWGGQGFACRPCYDGLRTWQELLSWSADEKMRVAFRERLRRHQDGWEPSQAFIATCVAHQTFQGALPVAHCASSKLRS